MTKLNSSHSETEEKLLAQIEKGNKVLTYNTVEEVSEYSDKWSSYTILLLKKMFSTEDYASEFEQCRRGVSFITYDRTYSEKLRDSKRVTELRIAKLESFVERLELLEIDNQITSIETKNALTINNHKVFIVHGHDGEAKQECARFLEKVGLEAIILHEQASKSKTIIEKIEEYSDVGFGVVIYTGCDVGAPKDGDKNLQNRARQNVIFEHGYLIGKLGRHKVTALVKGDVETPNDISGVVYIPMNDDSWKPSLFKELGEAGLKVDITKLLF